ncbi:sensor histidine kinase KdpD [Paenibacillus sp. 32O-W]|uniref:sensor histidine kinase n=1 Tax=Paenibacillus sp. 32O-W TaxID=1695218 RepID=UPI0011A94D07|nr:HAMP domain-containing sensor histidine kinase [Paenibacillus sp. 32O-W]
MDVRKRLILQFIFQLVFVGAVLIGLMVAMIYYLADQMTEMEMRREFAKAGLPKLVESMEWKDGNIQFDEKLLDEVKRSGGWLQTLDEEGGVITSYFTPGDVPDRYNPGELVDYWRGKKPFPYSLYIWIQVKGGTTYTLLYGVKPEGGQLVQSLSEQAVLSDGKILIPDDLEQKLKAKQGWVQVLDEQGDELASLYKPSEALTHYTLKDLIFGSFSTLSDSYQLWTKHEERTGLTWLVGLPVFAEEGTARPPFLFGSEGQLLLAGFIVLLIVVLLLFGVLSIWYGHRFGTPILHMIRWLQRLGKGAYEEPQDRKGLPRSRKPSGKLKRRYRLYTDVLQVLAGLTETLKRNDEIRTKLEKSREEWIAGVSHDLKTPLSSIKGYAHMLESDQYDWSVAEVREFAGVIKDKADYMDGLIADLSMTYRLKNGAMPLKMERTEMNEFIRGTVASFHNDPGFMQANIYFRGAGKPIYYSVDVHWFRRILDNLLANALIHNPAGTEIEVSLDAGAKNGFMLTVRDNGEGLDEEGLLNLFERYYRGTNTEGAGSGTGLGLAIAKHLVHEHGGTIEAESKSGHGVTIRMRFG